MSALLKTRRALRVLSACSVLLLAHEGAATGNTAAKPGADNAGLESPRPTPWIFPDPLRSNALFASGYAAPWFNPASAWVSSDGTHVAFFVREPSSAEGLSRTLVIKAVDTDTAVFEKTLFSEEESLQQGPALDRLARSRAREALASWPRAQWIPLVQQDLSSHEREFFSDACYQKQLHPQRSASLETLKITYQEPRVQVWRRGKKLLDRRVPSWKLKQEQCPRASPSWLNRAFTSGGRGVILLELGFCGTDLCPEPATAFHVLRIPSKAGAPLESQTPDTASAPRVRYETEGAAWRTLYVTGLPASSEDGEWVALAEVLPDGERGAPNLHLSVRRVQTNEASWTSTLLDATESASVQKAAPPLRQELDRTVRERIRLANEHLRDQHWVPLEEQPPQPIPPGDCPVDLRQTFRVGGWEGLFQRGRLTLKHDGTPLPGEQTPSAWSPGGSEAACTVPERTFLDAVYAAPPLNTLVLRLSSCVDDTCPRPIRGYHILQPPP
jgi:hypothetical protein